jgi:hypothetical protein
MTSAFAILKLLFQTGAAFYRHLIDLVASKVFIELLRSEGFLHGMTVKSCRWEEAKTSQQHKGYIHQVLVLRIEIILCSNG